MRYLLLLVLGATVLFASAQAVPEPVSQPASPTEKTNLPGLPPVPIPANNPQTPPKLNWAKRG